MDDFIRLRGVTAEYTVERSLDEFASADEAVMAYAHFLMALGYATESVRDALDKVSGEI